ncbi:MAG: carbohydrate ABC transporter permease, partial [Paracoccaceae bacterium]
MDNIAGTKSTLTWVVHLSVAFLVALWVFPTLGLFVSSFRTSDQISASGWWSAMFATEQNLTLRAASSAAQFEDGDLFVIEGNLFGEDTLEISRWGVSSRAFDAHVPGETVALRRGGEITVQINGDYRIAHTEAFTGNRGARVFVTAEVPAQATLANYTKVLFDKGSEGMGTAFLNTLIVTIPATIIPILVAAFAAYALAWMEFPGRALLVAFIVGLLVVPLQLALIPLLKLHLQIGIGKGYLGVWLAHTGFGMPLAIYLLRNYMVGLPRDLIENARVDGATDFQIFVKLILPLSFPALASFAIFQFLWT